MDFGHLLFNIDEEPRRYFRKLEAVKKKIVRANWSITFNNVCLQENIYRYIYIHIHIHIYINACLSSKVLEIQIIA